jgi:phage repressor protein C with HTH and peptisase S24 domain
MSVRKGDRVVARTKDGEVLAKVLGRTNDRSVELLSLNPDYKPRELPRSELAWMARILWASQ